MQHQHYSTGLEKTNLNYKINRPEVFASTLLVAPDPLGKQLSTESGALLDPHKWVGKGSMEKEDPGCGMSILGRGAWGAYTWGKVWVDLYDLPIVFFVNKWMSSNTTYSVEHFWAAGWEQHLLTQPWDWLQTPLCDYRANHPSRAKASWGQTYPN